MKQQQDGGPGSANYQAAGDINQYGFTVDQLIDLKQHLDSSVVNEVELVVNQQLETIKSDFVRFTGEANAQAMALAQHLLTTFIEQLAKRAPQNIEAMKTPAMQQSVLNACTSAAIADDEDLTQTLVDILVDKSDAEPRSFKGVVLNEALEVAGKLTPEQVTLLAALVMIRQTIVHGFDSADVIIADYDRKCRPLYGKIPTTESALQYMAYTGVGSTAALAANSMADLVCRIYDGILTSGFTADQLPEDLKPFSNNYPKVDKRLFVSDNGSERLRLPIASSQTFDKLQREGTLNEPYLTNIDASKALLTGNRLPVEKFRKFLIVEQPDLAQFLSDLDEISAPGFVLTPVGIAIGQANWRRLDPTAPDIDIYLR